mmetsp:Transcript_31624/g.78781  ORF Transcript_31624/g.78781 Transcript_31624/m.78781 type:complete len:115 (-) Transcript_31624:393-737(-)
MLPLQRLTKKLLPSCGKHDRQSLRNRWQSTTRSRAHGCVLPYAESSACCHTEFFTMVKNLASSTTGFLLNTLRQAEGSLLAPKEGETLVSLTANSCETGLHPSAVLQYIMRRLQ